jgi:hypothetical protein
MTLNISYFLLTPILFFSLSFIPAAPQQSSPTPQEWEVKYETGTQAVKHRRKMKVTVGSREIFCRSDKGEIFSVPVSGVATIFYDNTVHSRSVEWMKSGDWVTPYDPWFGPLPSLVTFGVGAAILAPFKSKDHFVHITWTQNDIGNVAVFEIGKKHFGAFLDRLSAATGKEWRNLPEEREKLREELDREKDNKVSLQLEHTVQAAGGELKSGLYQLVLLERGKDQGELYFFPGKKVELKKMVAVELVEIIRESNPVTSAEAIYHREGDVLRIVEIRLPGMTVKKAGAKE